MGWIWNTCPCCGSRVFRPRLSAHILAHEHPDDDPNPDLPRSFRHISEACSAETEIPEPIRHLYRELPVEAGAFLICSGCRRTLPLRDLVWTDTGESLACYLARLRARVPLLRRLLTLATTSVGGGTIGAALLFAYTGRIEGLALGLLVGAGFGIWLRPVVRQALLMSAARHQAEALEESTEPPEASEG